MGNVYRIAAIQTDDLFIFKDIETTLITLGLFYVNNMLIKLHRILSNITFSCKGNNRAKCGLKTLKRYTTLGWPKATFLSGSTFRYRRYYLSLTKDSTAKVP